MRRKTLLEQTLQRSARLLSPDRALVVVVRAHERFYALLVTDRPAERLVVQPENRGTGPAMLYGLLRLTAVGPPAPVAIFPADHYVFDDEAFMAHVDEAFEAVVARPDLLVLLGIASDTAEPNYGWIEPGEAIAVSRPSRLHRVQHFWEKPFPALARTLWAYGCLWNSFVMVGYPSAFFALIRSALPALFDAFASIQSRLTTPWEDDSLRPVTLMSPNDRRAWRDEFTYLLGDDLLVAPVVEPGARERELFIPEGVWIDWWEGRGYRGPDVVTVPAPLDRIPLFVRAGKIVPLAPQLPADERTGF